MCMGVCTWRKNFKGKEKFAILHSFMDYLTVYIGVFKIFIKSVLKVFRMVPLVIILIKKILGNIDIMVD